MGHTSETISHVQYTSFFFNFFHTGKGWDLKSMKGKKKDLNLKFLNLVISIFTIRLRRPLCSSTTLLTNGIIIIFFICGSLPCSFCYCMQVVRVSLFMACVRSPCFCLSKRSFFLIYMYDVICVHSAFIIISC